MPDTPQKATIQVAVPAITLKCPIGQNLWLHNIRVLKSGVTYAQYRGTPSGCGTCAQRKDCTSSTDPKYRREISLPVHDEVLALRDDLLARARAADRKDPQPRRPQEIIEMARRAEPLTRNDIDRDLLLPRLLLPILVAPGPWLPAAPVLFMSPLRDAWQDKHLQCGVAVKFSSEKRGQRAPAHIRATQAQRQCRRKSWLQRWSYNKLAEKVTITLITYA